MKYIILFILFVNFCFSQNRERTIKQIDSICNTDNTYNLHLDGIINVTNEKHDIIGEGGYSITINYIYTDEIFFNNLSDEDKKKYNRENNIKPIKAFHHQVIHYKNSYSENIYSEFYYQKQELFFIKLKVVRVENNKEKVLNYEFTKQDLENSKSTKNEFLFDVNSWIKNKSIEIQEIIENKK